MKLESCRSCGGGRLRPIIDFGLMPVADRLRTTQMLAENEPRYPLALVFCDDCALVQIDYTVSPKELFCNDYPYYSSFSPALLEHSRANAEDLIQSLGLGKESFVVEIASNDGYLLKNFVDHGIPVLGVDPAVGPARAAIEIGVRTDVEFFGSTKARRIVAAEGPADVILLNNVLAHVADTNDLVEGIGVLLAADGIASIEVPYVKNLIDNCEFDTIYHQHLCYFSLSALKALFERHGLHIVDVRCLAIHGGSLRIKVARNDIPNQAVTELLAQERRAGVDAFAYFERFADRTVALRSQLRTKLVNMREQGKAIAAYGAAAKGATLINYVEIGPELIDFVVDRNYHKHGKFMPGQELQIFPTQHLAAAHPDYCLLLAWNFVDEIAAQQEAYLNAGGRIIVPIPELRVI